jgi:small-conductance mechanosensitive channel
MFLECGPEGLSKSIYINEQLSTRGYTMSYQINFSFLGLIFSFLGSFFIALVLAKVFRFRRCADEERSKSKDISEEAKKDSLILLMNSTSRVARYSTPFAVIGIILLFLGFIFQSLALIAGSSVGLLIIVVCGIVALAFFVWDDL